MKTRRPIPSRPLATALAVSAVLALGACSSDDDGGDTTPVTEGPTTETPDPGMPGAPDAAAAVAVTLGTDAEVPPLVAPAPDASGTGSITVDGETGAASGEFTVSGLTGQATMAHIHRGFPGNAGPVVIGLEGSADGTTWTVPAGFAFDEAGREAYARGELYVNVHTDANPAGEVRGQVVPAGTTTFTVRIANVSSETTLNVDDGEGNVGTVPVPLSPGAYLVHRDPNDSPLLLPRDMANAGLEGVAEDGMPGPYTMGEEAIPGATIFDTPVDADEPGPALPGNAYEFTFTAVPGDKLGFVTMFVQSNDWFYTPTDTDNSIDLFGEDGAAVSGDVTGQVALWDAGTEVDETPGAGPNQVTRQSGPNTGDPDPNTAVGSLAGRGQSADLNGDVIQVTITPAAP